MAARFHIPVPGDFVLARDACSYGYFLLAPCRWDPASAEFRTTLNAAGRAITVTVSQGDAGAPATAREMARRRGVPLAVRADVAPGRDGRADIEAQLSRMFRLDEDAAAIRDFHNTDPRWRRSGRGRLMRSATLFEDVVKTITSCNVAWPSTIIMNRRLCEVAGLRSASGLHAFPTAARLARMRPQTLRARCGVGYRDARIVEIARLFARDAGPAVPRAAAARDVSWPTRAGFTAWLENPATHDDAIHDALLELPGIGPYAAANILQLLGRYARLPLDTESIRHAKSVLGYTGDDRALMKKIRAHYEPFGAHRFRSYWFELWAFYEQRRGPAWTWERDTTGKTFTASKL